MTWLYIVAPLISVLAVFIAYLGGKSSGRKEAELKQKTKEQNANNEAAEIINNNSNLSDADFAAWLRERANK